MSYADSRIRSATVENDVPPAMTGSAPSSGHFFQPRQPRIFTAHLLDYYTVAGIQWYLRQTDATVEVISEWRIAIKAGSLIKIVQEDDGRWRLLGVELGPGSFVNMTEDPAGRYEITQVEAQG